MSESDTPTPDQKPSVGRIVHVPMPTSANNGADLAPAVITQVWDETTINVRIFSDNTSNPQEWRTSLKYVDELPVVEGSADLYCWTWPERV